MTRSDTAEHRRLAEATGRAEDDLFDANPWYEWGPYLSERAWGTVREDYSADGDAWVVLPARPRQVPGLPLERGRDGRDLRHPPRAVPRPRAVERPGPDPQGADVRPDRTAGQPRRGRQGVLVVHGGAAQPRPAPVALPLPAGASSPTSGWSRRTRAAGSGTSSSSCWTPGPSTTGASGSVDVTYAKASATDIYMSITVDEPRTGRGDAARPAHPVVPQHLALGGAHRRTPAVARPGLGGGRPPLLAGYRLDAAPGPDGTPPQALFCDNETNVPRLYGGAALTAFPKDGINDHVVTGADTVNPSQQGTKAALLVPAHGPGRGHRRRSGCASTCRQAAGGAALGRPGVRPGAGRAARRRRRVLRRTRPGTWTRSACASLRQAAPGLVWSKQMYPYRVSRWLDGDPAGPPPPESHRHGRNAGWRHLDSFDVLAMPDPWEYPWFAAWDLAFHAIAWAHLDPAFAKYQLTVLLREWFQHPNGALPAYEWNFDDVNPPVHALAALRVFVIDGSTDVAFLERVFQKLLLNFTWWLNRQDPEGNNLFGGGFLGLDNISPVDRSHLPDGVRIEQADGTAWMAEYSLAMSILALLLASREPGLRRHGREVPRAVRPHLRCAGEVRSLRPGGRVLLRPAHRRRGERHSGQGADPGRRHSRPGDRRRCPGPGRTARRAAQARRPAASTTPSAATGRSCRSREGERRWTMSSSPS